MEAMDKYVRTKRAISLPIILILASAFLFFVGTLINQSQKNAEDYLTTQGTIVSIEAIEEIDENTTYEAVVEYTVEGATYTASISVSENDRVGDSIEVKYDSQDPSMYMIGDAGSLGIILYVVGGLLLVGAVVSIVISVKKSKIRKQQDKDIKSGEFVTPDGDFGAISYTPNTEMKLYFSLDKKMMQGGFLEDENKKKVYEAIFEKVTFVKATKCTFTNHLTGKSQDHMIGHTVSSEGGGFGSTSSWFSYDGQNVWDYLHSYGIRIETGFSGETIGYSYRITRCGKPYADVISTGVKNHEDEVGSNPLKMLSVRGFYRITAYSDDIDLLFLTVFAFSRTEQDYHM